MTATGVIVPRVVVRPPNVPAPPPISLLTQGNVVDGLPDAVQAVDNPARWEGGGGTAWWEPLRQMSATQTWQTWPDAGGTATADKLHALDGTITVPRGPDSSFDSPDQRPIIASLEILQGALAAFVLDNGAPEGSVDQQMERALDAVMPRIIARELWDAGEAVRAKWLQQFRLKGDDMVTNIGTTAIPFLRALAVAEQAAADYKFIDSYGGAFIHVTPALFSLLASASHGLVRSPTGRQVMTMTGCALVPEVGATGEWTESATTDIIAARPGASPAGDNLATGWMFVTPPVRIRLGAINVYSGSFQPDTNDYTIVGERAFTIEASVGNDTVPTSVGIPVDYTKEYV